jgi:hypothetical protein
MVAGQTFTQSCYIKTNGRNRVQLQIFDSSAIYVSALFDVVSGTIIATNGTSSIESVGNGWYRCIVSGVCPTSTIGYCVINLATDSYTQSTAQESYTGDTSKGVYLWGAQLNIGSTAKPYFPTTDRLNVPRLTYQNGGGGCPSLLLEKQSTNLVTYSEQFDNAAWTKNVSVTANAITSPDGTQNADKILENASNVQQWAYQSPVMVGAQVGTIYAKKGERNYIAMATAGLGPSYFNLDTGVVVSSASGATASIENVGNGWYRCSVSSPSIVGGTFFIVWISDNGTRTSYAGDSSKGVYVWGAQNEASSYPTSYIPTTSSSATRVADGPLNLSTTQTLTNFTLFYDGLIFENGQNMFFGSGNSAWYIDIDGSNGRIVLDLASGRIYNAFSSLRTNQRVKLAVKRSAGVVDAFVNGTKLTPNTQVTDTTSLTLSSITWGFSSTYYPKMKVNEICAFQSALSDSDCQALTTL